MIDRRAVLILGLAGVIIRPALAAPAPLPFSQAAFAAAQKSGRPILVEIQADWCPTCKAQASILSELRDEPTFKDMSFSGWISTRRRSR